MPHDPQAGLVGIPFTYEEVLRGMGPHGPDTVLPCNRDIKDPICPKGYKTVAFTEVLNGILYYSSAPGWYFKDPHDASWADVTSVISSHTTVTATQLHDHIIALDVMPDDGVPSFPAPHPTPEEYTKWDLEDRKRLKIKKMMKYLNDTPKHVFKLR